MGLFQQALMLFGVQPPYIYINMLSSLTEIMKPIKILEMTNLISGDRVVTTSYISHIPM
jgi:hypothetical protein